MSSGSTASRPCALRSAARRLTRSRSHASHVPQLASSGSSGTGTARQLEQTVQSESRTTGGHLAEERLAGGVPVVGDTYAAVRGSAAAGDAANSVSDCLDMAGQSR